MNLSLLPLEYYENFLRYRYDSFRYIFKTLLRKKACNIVELGTSRSFVSTDYEGCMSDANEIWEESQPQKWDWGAGIFTRVCAEVIAGTEHILHTVDPHEVAIKISKRMTIGYEKNVIHYLTDSTAFLRNFENKIDVLYMDHHETCEEGALLHLSDLKMILSRDLLSRDALILVDDVHFGYPFNYKAIQNSPNFDQVKLGKGQYSIPYLMSNGFEIMYEGYQMILKRKH